MGQLTLPCQNIWIDIKSIVWRRKCFEVKAPTLAFVQVSSVNVSTFPLPHKTKHCCISIWVCSCFHQKFGVPWVLFLLSYFSAADIFPNEPIFLKVITVNRKHGWRCKRKSKIPVIIGMCWRGRSKLILPIFFEGKTFEFFSLHWIKWSQ